jgi:hypothetical protein
VSVDIAERCRRALSAISEWETLIEESVAVEVREDEEGLVNHPPYHTPTRSWSGREGTGRRLGCYISNEITDSIESAKTVLRNWEAAFAETINRANNFTTAINNDAHIEGLRDRVEQAIYPVDSLESLQVFANNARTELRDQARIYNECASFIHSRMQGPTVMAYAEALQRGARYFEAIAQTIDADFWNGNYAGGNTIAPNGSVSGNPSLQLIRSFSEEVAGEATSRALDFASQHGPNVGHALGARLQPRDSSGRFVRDTNPLRRTLTSRSRSIRLSTGRNIGKAARWGGRGLVIVSAVLDARDHYRRNGNVGRAISYSGFITVVAVGIGVGIAAFGGVPLWLAAGLTFVLVPGARRLYNNTPVGDVVRGIGDGINAVGRGIRNIGRRINPFRR